MTQGLYCVDTSALIDGLERYYPEENFPALWERVDDLVIAGRLFISEEVWEEVKQKDERVQAWVQPRLEALMIRTDQAIVNVTQQILNRHQLLVKNMKGRNRADPFVIAVARIRGAIVVTGEGSDGTASRPKIPYICDQIGLPCIRFLDVIQTEGWRF